MSDDLQGPASETTATSSRQAVDAALQFLRLLRRRKLYVISAVTVAAVLGTLYYLTATRLYEANASVLVLQTGGDVWNTSMSVEGARNGLIPTYERLFSSAVVLEGALKQLRQMPPEIREDLTGVAKEKQVDVLRGNLRARGVRNTNVIEITYRSKSPQAAEAVVNAIVQSYLSFMAQNHKDVSVEIVNMLDKERRQVQEQLVQKERELSDARARAGDFGLSDDMRQVHPAVERALSVNRTLLGVQEERLQLEASLAAIHDALRNGADLQQHLIAIEPYVGREMIRSAMGLGAFDQQMVPRLETKLLDDRAKRDALLQHYGPNHPQVVEIEQSIRNTEQYLDGFQSNISDRLAKQNDGQLGPTLVSLVREKLARSRAYERELEQHYKTLEAEAVRLNGQYTEVSLLDHELRRLRQLHDTMLNQIANIDIKQNQADVRIAIVSDPKASLQPVSPKRNLVALLCLVGGLGSGAAIGYVVDLLDDRFRTPEELRDQLRTQVLAVIRPLTVVESAGVGAVHVHVNPTAVENESFRTLRTTLAFAGQERDRLAVSSAEPGDGKTTIISNLAASFAQAGKRTLMIDADMRKPGLSKLFQLRGLPGLSDVLRSSEPLGEMCQNRIHNTGINCLDLLPCGPKPADPSELLSGPRLEELIAWAETHYDQVLIDTPPILAASDAAVAGRLVDGIILVVQPGKNHRRLVLRAVDEVRLMKVNLVGVVANRVGTEDDDGYYGYGYGYGYGNEEVETDRDADADDALANTNDPPSDEQISPRRAA